MSAPRDSGIAIAHGSRTLRTGFESGYRPAMIGNLVRVFALLAICATSLSCGSDVEGCNVADACLSRCEEECAPDPVMTIGCVGNICNCFCEDNGGGGTAGTGSGGMSGAGGG